MSTETRRILLVEDEKTIRDAVAAYLEREGYWVTPAEDGQVALDAFAKHRFELVVLDLMLPKVSGEEVCRQIRNASDVPIIMLTARREEMDRITGLEMGADDYMVKPFSPQELVSRVRAVLRRAGGDKSAEGERPLSFDDLSIDPLSRTVSVRGQSMDLTVKEFDMLYLLARHPRQVFSRDHLLERVWGASEYIDPGTVTVHVRRLREKIEADPSHPLHLLTVWGVGYKFEP